jgi:hypothetical protein
MFIVKQGDALSSLLFNFALEYAFRNQGKQEEFKLNVTEQFLTNVDDSIG